jgi:O-antigen/teichoic acid export membrane protein
MVFIVAGFLLPRMMDKTMGAAMLGVWDFSWSFVGYLRLIQLDVGSSVNRYVAKYRAQNNYEGLNRSVCSVMIVQIAMGLLILLVTGGICLIMPYLWGETLGKLLAVARWLVFLLGASTAFSFSMGAFSGVTTGYHRWDIYNLINSSAHLVSVLTMLALLKAGFGLLALGVVYACERVCASLLHCVAAHLICRKLSVSPRNFSIHQARAMLGFGGKGFATSMGRTLLYQTNSILLVRYLGPVSLAIYSRPLALFNQLRTFIAKFAHTLVPISSELKASKDSGALKDFILRSGAYGIYFALPPVVLLAVFGNVVMDIWMGEEYSRNCLVGIFAVGHFPAIANFSIYTILMGLNQHGYPALVNSVCAAGSIALSAVLLGIFHMDKLSVAISISSALAISDGMFLPWFLCRSNNLRISEYLQVVWGKTLLHCLPFIVVVSICKVYFDGIQGLLLGMSGGGAVLSVIYYRILVPPRIKKRLGKLFSGKMKK